MGIEPWKVMIGLSILLVIIGAVLHFEITQPSQFAAIFIFGIIFLVLTYAGYRMGQLLAERKMQ